MSERIIAQNNPVSSHHRAKRVMALIAGMTKEEQIAFWKEEHRKLVEHKRLMTEKAQKKND